MRNFVKVLLVGTVLAGACVLLPNDSWAQGFDDPAVLQRVKNRGKNYARNVQQTAAQTPTGAPDQAALGAHLNDKKMSQKGAGIPQEQRVVEPPAPDVPNQAELDAYLREQATNELMAGIPKNSNFADVKAVSNQAVVNSDNASAIGNLLDDDLSLSKNGYTMTPEQKATLENLYGITFDPETQQISFTGNKDKLGADVVDYMNSLSGGNGKEGYRSLLETHSENIVAQRVANSAVSAAQTKMEAAQAKLAKLNEEKASAEAIDKARGEVDKAQAALDKAKEEGKAVEDKYNATKDKLKSIVDAAWKNHDTAKNTAKLTAGDIFKDSADLDKFNTAIDNGDFGAARGMAEDALKNKTISQDDFDKLNNQIAAVENTKAEAEDKQAEVNKVEEEEKRPIEVDLQDLIRISLLAATPFVTEEELALRGDVNVLAGEIGPAVGVVEDTALSDLEIDASMPSTVSGAAMTVAELLKSAKVDLKLLDETFKEEEAEKTVVETGKLAGAGSQAGTSASLEVPEEKPSEEPKDEKKYLTEEQVALIKEKRQMLMKQYVNAAVQISEGMNAVSNKFADRANVLISFSEGVQNEAGVFGLTQDVGRYVLLESLRAVALSSAQMGVQAARLLNEQEVDNEIK